MNYSCWQSSWLKFRAQIEDENCEQLQDKMQTLYTKILRDFHHPHGRMNKIIFHSSNLGNLEHLFFDWDASTHFYNLYETCVVWEPIVSRMFPTLLKISLHPNVHAKVNYLEVMIKLVIFFTCPPWTQKTTISPNCQWTYSKFRPWIIISITWTLKLFCLKKSWLMHTQLFSFNFLQKVACVVLNILKFLHIIL